MAYSKLFRKNLGRLWPPICAPQAQLNFWLKLGASRFARNFKPELRGAGLIESEWAALRELYRPGRLSPVDIGRAIGMTKGGASKLVDRLVKKRLVKKEVGKYDHRFRTVEITRKGKYLIMLLATWEEAAECRSFKTLQPDEHRQLMQRLKQTLGAEQAEYSDQWISLNGREGQWKSQNEWRSSFSRQSSGSNRIRSGQQSLQLFGGQLAEPAPG